MMPYSFKVAPGKKVKLKDYDPQHNAGSCRYRRAPDQSRGEQNGPDGAGCAAAHNPADPYAL
jgi:hypothetical protein